ncbi:neoverrucotoxin subunit alpha-like isoform X1 [Embiotoca jacksoni]|uniref:neoverrucotoxin subunit alpha-like isoform X1 n=2 Tax=Embiotoca jacksoni TaxID=100190 RepID=UPI0037048215
MLAEIIVVSDYPTYLEKHKVPFQGKVMMHYSYVSGGGVRRGTEQDISWHVAFHGNRLEALVESEEDSADQHLHQVGEMDSQIKSVAALGRPFTLGMLYDARRDELIPGVTLWDEKTVQENTVKSSQPSSTFQISSHDSTEEKSFLLDVSASLKVSFCSGLIQAGGSAKYLDNQKKFHSQSRVTLQYKATTHFQQLMTNQGTMTMQPTAALEKGLATHVVTGILYGANAFFVFDSEKVDASHVQDIHGKMEAVIKKIPTVNIEGSAELKLTDEEKKLCETFSCKFYGDFLLEKNPATFADTVEVYVQLPKLIGAKGENSVPLKVWLMPLKDLDFNPTQLKLSAAEAPQVTGITVGLVRKVENVLDDLNQLVMRCNDSLEENVVKEFPQMHEMMSSFQKLCGYYISVLKATMAEKIPLIRAGKEDESSLKKLFEDGEHSPFSHYNLTKWLEDKEREINIMKSCVEAMEETKIVPNQSDLDRQVLAAGVQHTLVFVFTSVENTDSFLDQLAAYMDHFNLDQPLFTAAGHDPAKWYWSDEVSTAVREKARAFCDVVKTLKSNSRFRFLTAAIANSKHPGATIYHYKDGVLVSDDFSKPDITDVEKVTDRTDLLWYFCNLSLDPNTANNHLLLSDDNKKVTYGEDQGYPDNPARFGKHPQVLCRESLSGQHYWEVERSDLYVEHLGVAVAYKGIDRKQDSKVSAFGNNDLSWYHGLWSFPKEDGTGYNTGLSAWHENKMTSLCYVGWKRVGVYLNWPAGTLSFYQVCSDTLTHLYTFRNRFSEPLYPAFWLAKPGNYVTLCPVE